jgi:SET domain-containing protein
MKPWTARNQIGSALRNAHVCIRQTGAGRGIYATRAFATGECVASYHGRIIDRAELVSLHGSDRVQYDLINEYAVATPSGGHLYPNDLDALGAHLINHSCGPNARWAEYERGVLLVRATRPIAAGDEITVHYGWLGIKAAMEDRRHTCVCKAPYCTGTVELDGAWGGRRSPVSVSSGDVEAIARGHCERHGRE